MDKHPILLVSLKVAPEKEQEFNHWYQDLYIPKLLNLIPEFLSARRYVSTGDGERHYLTVYEFADEASMEKAMKALGNPARAKDREEWHQWEETYLKDMTDGTFRQVYP